jgi:RNA polymerase sigma factor (TIGR02999 family)
MLCRGPRLPASANTLAKGLSEARVVEHFIGSRFCYDAQESMAQEVAQMAEITHLLSEIECGDADSADRLLPLVYDELRKIAAARLAHEKPGQTLQATALVHEAYLRLVGPIDSDPQRWASQGHFFAAAAESMRRILVESARRKRRLKHGGNRQRVDLDAACSVLEPPCVDLIALDQALTKLAEIEPSKAHLVKLRFFAGLTMPQIALAMNISLATAERHWTFARSWLYAQMAGDHPTPAK